MIRLPPGPYPDGSPEESAKFTLEQGMRGAGTISHDSSGDYRFHSGHWKTIHGPAVVVRTDKGAYRVWNALLPDGRRTHCRRSQGMGVWRRRSDDGRSWTLGTISFEADDVLFDDGRVYAPQPKPDDNHFARVAADRPDFIQLLRDDSVAFSLNRALWNEGLCSFDGQIGWNPTRGEAAEVIACLRGLGETHADFEFGGPDPHPPQLDVTHLLEILASIDWRFQNDEEYARFENEGAGPRR